jgi:hypothetical protein
MIVLEKIIQYRDAPPVVVKHPRDVPVFFLQLAIALVQLAFGLAGLALILAIVAGVLAAVFALLSPFLMLALLVILAVPIGVGLLLAY